MPTVLQNIAYFIKRYIVPKRAIFEHLGKSMVVLIALALALEAFVFNLNYFASASYDTIDLKNKIHLRQDKNEQFRLTSVNHEMEFTNLNTEVHDIFIGLAMDQPAQRVLFKIQFTDEAHLTYFDTTEYTVGLPEVQIATNNYQSQFINLNSTGLMNNLKITVVGDEVSYPIYLDTVKLNAHHPFDFNGLRFSLVLGLLILGFMFRPRSAVYRIHILENPKESKAGIIATVIIECLLVSSFLFYGSNLVGVATSQYNYGEWDGTSLVNVYEVGGDNAQQYAELARSMAEGKLYLEEEPPEWLKNMDEPYDKGARDEAQKETGEDYLFDVAYYDGHYYVYFGVVPVLIFYLPFYLLTGENFPTALGVLFSVLMFILGTSVLLDRFARYHFKRVSLGLYLLMQIAMVSGCGILYLIKFPTFYSLPLACGLAFSVWGLYFWLRGRASRRRRLCFFVGSLCMAMVAGCRPQLLLLSLLAFPLFWRPYIKERRLFSKAGATEFACLIAPYLIVAAGIMIYNHARFGSFTDFGANYNLTVNDMTKRGWVLGRLAPAFFAYFIQPPNVCGTFPFLQPVDFATTYMGQTVKEVTYGGIFATYPVLWVLFFAAPIVRMRNAQRSTKTISGVIVVLILSGLAIGLLDAQMAGILERYYADFSFMFFAAIVLLVFILNENMGAEIATPLRRIALKTLMVLVALGVLYSTLLCLVPETGWYSDIYPWAYQNIVESFEFWT